MEKNKFYLTIARHERYGTDTPIEREDMLVAYLSGVMLKSCLPPCDTVYHSPLARAVSTARFEALGLHCSHLLEIAELEESTPTYTIHRFINNLLQNTTEDVQYYHLVTHLPVAEKLGLPFLGAGEMCLLTAENKTEMLKENFTIQVLKRPEIPTELCQKVNLTISGLSDLSEDEIYKRLADLEK